MKSAYKNFSDFVKILVVDNHEWSLWLFYIHVHWQEDHIDADGSQILGMIPKLTALSPCSERSKS